MEECERRILRSIGSGADCNDFEDTEREVLVERVCSSFRDEDEDFSFFNFSFEGLFSFVELFFRGLSASFA